MTAIPRRIVKIDTKARRLATGASFMLRIPLDNN